MVNYIMYNDIFEVYDKFITKSMIDEFIANNDIRSPISIPSLSNGDYHVGTLVIKDKSNQITL
jgi:hypothetical protein